MSPSIKTIYKNNKEIKNISIDGWVISNRGNDKVRFITLNDGSTQKTLQAVLKNNPKKFENLKKGTPITIYGDIVLTPKNKQPLELKVSKINIHCDVSEKIFLQKQKITLEMLRKKIEVRHQTNLIKSIMRIRSSLAQEVHAFFLKHNFLYLHSPIITSNDGEGAGDLFIVDKENKKNFFNKKATLCVTGQLHAEVYATGFKKVYTFGPTFRAEDSHTKKHISEFWMIEPEIMFFKLDDAISFAIKLMKEITKNVLKKNKEEFEFLDQYHSNKLFTKINSFLKENPKIITYKEIVEIINKNSNYKINFGDDISSEQEKFICKFFNKVVVIKDFPKEIKAFYMKENKDKKTVASFDILFPNIGEVVGGSEREANIVKLKKRMKQLNINPNDYEWYLNLRKQGHCGSSGFGIGFERLLMFITNMQNIRDVIPFPRSSKNLKL